MDMDMKDSNIRNRPYVYLRADDIGLRMTDGRTPKYIALTPGDIVKAKKSNSKRCAFARASLKLPGVLAAYFFRSTAFLEYDDRMERYLLPNSVQKEIVSFDRSGIMAAGVYHLAPPTPSASRKARSKANALQRQATRERKLRSASGIRLNGARTKAAPTNAQRNMHRTQYIRDLREPK